MNSEWVYCPICKSKTRIKICKDTVVKRFPLFCPKCKHEMLIEIENCVVKIMEDSCVNMAD